MSRKLREAVDRWLHWESQNHQEGAEEALFKVFSRLPLPLPSQGFAERVLEGAGLMPVRWVARRSRAAVWSSRAVLSLCLALAALAVSLLPSLLPSLLGILHPGRVTELGLAALVSALQSLGSGLVLWRALGEVGAILASVFASPPYILALLTGALMSIGAFRILHGLILPERSSQHVRTA